MNEEIEYINLEIKRYCELTISIQNNENIGNSSLCEIYEIDLNAKKFFIKNFIKLVCDISGANIISSKEKGLFEDINRYLNAKIKYYNNIFFIECEFIDNEDHFDVVITTTLIDE